MGTNNSFKSDELYIYLNTEAFNVLGSIKITRLKDTSINGCILVDQTHFQVTILGWVWNFLSIRSRIRISSHQ